MAIEKRLIQTNFESNRSGYLPEFIIIHTYNGVGESLYNWFNNPKTKLSSHYAIFLNGEGEQYLEEDWTGYHAGNYETNLKSIGIEHADNGIPSDAIRTDVLYETSAQLCADIYKRQGWDIENLALIKPHKEFADTGCPGGLDINRIRSRVNELLHPQDNLYRIQDSNGKQLNAYKIQDNAFNFWLDDITRKVIYNGTEITSQFNEMANKLQDQISKLEDDKKNLNQLLEASQNTVTTQSETITKQNTQIEEFKKSLLGKLYFYIKK